MYKDKFLWYYEALSLSFTNIWKLLHVFHFQYYKAFPSPLKNGESYLHVIDILLYDQKGSFPLIVQDSLDKSLLTYNYRIRPIYCNYPYKLTVK